MTHTPGSPDDPIMQMLRSMAEGVTTNDAIPVTNVGKSDINQPSTTEIQGSTIAVREKTRASLSGETTQNSLQDLVTGERVVNIPWRERTPEDSSWLTSNHINQLGVYAQGDRPVDVRKFVAELNLVHLPGFSELLSAEEQLQLGNASPALCRKIHVEIQRAILAYRTNIMTEKMDRGLEQRIAPLVRKIQSSEIRRNVSECLEIWDVNKKQNPYRNVYERTQRIDNKNPYIMWEYGPPLLAIDPCFFSVGLFEGGFDIKNVEAGYAAPSATMFLRATEGPDVEFTKLLSVMHELTHKRFDRELVEAHGVRPLAGAMNDTTVARNTLVCITEEDCQAIASEVELMFAATGFGTVSPESLARTLGVTTKEGINQIARTLYDAQAYYPRGITEEFCKNIEARYKKAGGKIYTRDTAGWKLREKLD